MSYSAKDIFDQGNDFVRDSVVNIVAEIEKVKAKKPANDNTKTSKVFITPPTVDPFDFEAVGGLMGECARWIFDTSRSPIREFSVMSAIAAMSVFFGRRCVGPTGHRSIEAVSDGVARYMSGSANEALKKLIFGHIQDSGKEGSRATYNARAQYHPTKSEPIAARYYPVDESSVPRWAGPYLGFHAGMGFGKWPTSISSLSAQNGVAGAPVNFSGNHSAVGGLAGLQAGYMWQVGAFVFGPEFDVSVSTVGSKKNLSSNYFTSYSGGWNSGTYSSPTATSFKWMSTIRGRVGVAAGDWLFFGTGGLATAGLDLESGWANTTTSQVAIGYAVGGGLQYAFGPNARLRMEYLYYGFPEKTAGTHTSFSSFCNGCTPQLFTYTNTASMSVRPSMNVIRAGIDWRFN